MRSTSLDYRKEAIDQVTTTELLAVVKLQVTQSYSNLERGASHLAPRRKSTDRAAVAAFFLFLPPSLQVVVSSASLLGTLTLASAKGHER